MSYFYSDFPFFFKNAPWFCRFFTVIFLQPQRCALDIFGYILYEDTGWLIMAESRRRESCQIICLSNSLQGKHFQNIWSYVQWKWQIFHISLSDLSRTDIISLSSVITTSSCCNTELHTMCSRTQQLNNKNKDKSLKSMQRFHTGSHW